MVVTILTKSVSSSIIRSVLSTTYNMDIISCQIIQVVQPSEFVPHNPSQGRHTPLEYFLCMIESFSSSFAKFPISCKIGHFGAYYYALNFQALQNSLYLAKWPILVRTITHLILFTLLDVHECNIWVKWA